MATNEMVLKRLIDLKLVPSESDGNCWLAKERISSFGGKTASELIIEGQVAAVLEHIERIADGGYA